MERKPKLPGRVRTHGRGAGAPLAPTSCCPPAGLGGHRAASWPPPWRCSRAGPRRPGALAGPGPSPPLSSGAPGRVSTCLEDTAVCPWLSDPFRCYWKGGRINFLLRVGWRRQKRQRGLRAAPVPCNRGELVQDLATVQCSGLLQVESTSSASRAPYLFFSDQDDFSFFFLPGCSAWSFHSLLKRIT